MLLRIASTDLWLTCIRTFFNTAGMGEAQVKATGEIASTELAKYYLQGKDVFDLAQDPMFAGLSLQLSVYWPKESVPSTSEEASSSH